MSDFYSSVMLLSSWPLLTNEVWVSLFDKFDAIEKFLFSLVVFETKIALYW